jgi:hypothetical protein
LQYFGEQLFLDAWQVIQDIDHCQPGIVGLGKLNSTLECKLSFFPTVMNEKYIFETLHGSPPWASNESEPAKA